MLDVLELEPPNASDYEPEVVDVIKHFVRQGDCAIDVGASVGFFATMLGKIVGEDGVVLAFEPHTESFKILLINVHCEHKLNNVGCFKRALWDSDGKELVLWSVDPSVALGYSTMLPQFSEGRLAEKVETYKLDSLLPAHETPRFIKIDCEGVEEEILRGAEKTLRRGVDCVVLEFNFHIMNQANRSMETIRSFMNDLGYDLFLIGVGPKPIKIEPNVHIGVRVTGDRHWMNVMFSTEEKVRERWETSKTADI